MGIFLKKGNWFIDFWYQGKRFRKKVSPNKKQAELALKKKQVEIAENKFFDTKKEVKILFSEMAKEYLERYAKLNKKSFNRDEQSIRHLNKVFGNKHLGLIKPLDIEDYKSKRLNDGVTGPTINRELACMKTIFSKAIEWEKATDNPVKKVKLFKENNQRARFLEKDEMQLLINNCSGLLKPIVIVALNTGMRQNEIISLTWDNIDLVRGIISVKDTKNKEARYVPVNTILINLFTELKNKWNKKSEFVFCDSKGKKLTRFGSLRGQYNLAVKKSGIEDFTFHDLRHTFASNLVMAGVDIVTVKELLGHKTLAMTLRYSHLSPNFKRSAVELLVSKMDTFWTLSEKTTDYANSAKLGKCS